MKQQCEDDIHDWEYSSWGVIIGVSKCRKCGKVAKEKDFVVSANFEQILAPCLNKRRKDETI